MTEIKENYQSPYKKEQSTPQHSFNIVDTNNRILA